MRMDGEQKCPAIVLSFKYVSKYAVLILTPVSKVVKDFLMRLKTGPEVGVGLHNS